MSQRNTIADFKFVTNKSFFGRGNPITVPSRFYQALKENGLIESTPAKLSFADGEPIAGAIYMNWRAGGKYYQVRVNNVPANHDITLLKQGVTLRVLLSKQADDWYIELMRL